MSFVTARQPRPSNINLKRDDTRTPNIDHKKIGPSLSNIRKPNLDPKRVEKLLEAKKNALREKKEQLEQGSKGKGFR
jgi:hypothetical protein